MIELRKDFKLTNTTLINFVNMDSKKKEMVRQWRNNENIRTWMYSPHTISYKEHNKFIAKLKNEDKDFFWLVRNKKSKYIGVICLKRVDVYNKNAYLGIY